MEYCNPMKVSSVPDLPGTHKLSQLSLGETFIHRGEVYCRVNKNRTLTRHANGQTSISKWNKVISLNTWTESELETETLVRPYPTELIEKKSASS